MRRAAVAENDIRRMAAWAGQSAALARPEPGGRFRPAQFGPKPGAFTIKPFRKDA